MKLLPVAATAAVFCAVLVACSAANGGGPDGGSGGSTGGAGGSTGGAGGSTGGSGGSSGNADQACTDLATATCSKLTTCSPFLISIVYADMATCVARTKISCLDMVTLTGSGVTPAQLTACGQAYGALSCSDALGGLNPPTACDLVGTLADGAACGSKVQCQSGNCSVTGAGSCGICAPRVAAGQTCAGSSDCAAGLMCKSSHCVTPVAAGGTCSSTLPCVPGLYCSAANVCTAPATTVGATCVATTASTCDFNIGLLCDGSTNHCAAIPTAAAGSACGVSGGGYVFCTGGSTCVMPVGTTTGTCVAPVADGSSCAASDGGTDLGCVTPASCVSGVCTLPNPAACH